MNVSIRSFTPKLLLPVAFALWAASALAGGKNRVATVYAFGFASSFSDSTVYFTDVMPIDSASVEEKTGFLLSRAEYVDQLRAYMQEKHGARMVCVLTFAEKRKDAEKKFVALRKRYMKKPGYEVKYIAPADFTFRPVVLPPEKRE